MTTLEFQLAVDEVLDEQPEEVAYDVNIDVGPHELSARLPTEPELLAFFGRIDQGGARAIGAVWRLVTRLFPPEDVRILENLVEDGKIDFGLIFGGEELNEGRSILGMLIEQASARPTQPSGGSSASSPTTGRRSTGRSPGKGSTASTPPAA